MKNFKWFIGLMCLIIALCLPLKTYALESKTSKVHEFIKNTTNISSVEVDGYFSEVSMINTDEENLKIKLEYVGIGKNEENIQKIFDEMEVKFEEEDGKYIFKFRRNGEYLYFDWDELKNKEIDSIDFYLTMEIPQNIKCLNVNGVGKAKFDEIKFDEIDILSYHGIKGNVVNAKKCTFKVSAGEVQIGTLDSKQINIVACNDIELNEVYGEKCELASIAGNVDVRNLNLDEIYISSCHDIKLDKGSSEKCELSTSAGGMNIGEISSDLVNISACDKIVVDKITANKCEIKTLIGKVQCNEIRGDKLNIDSIYNISIEKLFSKDHSIKSLIGNIYIGNE